jgi:hypothetical protein
MEQNRSHQRRFREQVPKEAEGEYRENYCNGRGAVMPINRLFREGKIKPEEVERLNRAFTFALSALSLVDRNDPICEIVAHKVIEIDAAGTHDPEEIARLAVKQLAIT